MAQSQFISYVFVEGRTGDVPSAHFGIAPCCAGFMQQHRGLTDTEMLAIIYGTPEAGWAAHRFSVSLRELKMNKPGFCLMQRGYSNLRTLLRGLICTVVACRNYTLPLTEARFTSRLNSCYHQ